MTFEKDNGIFYTPRNLADFVAKVGIERPNDTVFDPCFGGGALLEASIRRLKELKSKTLKKNIYGMDISPDIITLKERGLFNLYQSKHLREMNFFSRCNEDFPSLFDVIIMNPPYIRHHNIQNEMLDKIRKLSTISIWNVPKTSDMWVYFLLHSLSFLKKNSRLVAILPWSIISADYGKKIRYILSNEFNKIDVYVFGTHFFQNAKERIAILIAKKRMKGRNEISIKYYRELPVKMGAKNKISREIWHNNPWLGTTNNAVEDMLGKFAEENGFNTLGTYAKITLGIVTGANNFFILNKEKAKQMGLPSKYLLPIIRKTRELNGINLNNRRKIKNRLLSITETEDISNQPLQEYIKQGYLNRIHLKYHCANRNEWFSLFPNEIPDAFLHYMTTEIPYIIRNQAKVYSTNTIHNIYFNKDVDDNTIEWIQMSMLCSLTQLSIEVVARTYGDGVLKLEPGRARNIIIYPGNGEKVPSRIIERVNRYLEQGEKRKAMDIVDKWIAKSIGMGNDELVTISRLYQDFRIKRMKR